MYPETWLEGIKHTPSPNFDARPIDEEISLLVIHNISLPPGVFMAMLSKLFFRITLMLTITLILLKLHTCAFRRTCLFDATVKHNSL